MRNVIFIFSVVTFLFSLLTVIPAPIYPLWKPTIVVTEFGHWLFLLPLGLSFYIFFSRRALIVASTALSVIAIGLFLYPAFKAYQLAPTFRSHFSMNFPESIEFVGKPFQFSKLWLNRSEPRVTIQKLNYMDRSNPSWHLDFYPAFVSTGTLAPLVVVIHGGGWSSGKPDQLSDLNHHLANRGYHVASVAYRLAPVATWPAQKDDVVGAIRYLRENADKLKIQTDSIFVLGRSAGGQIAEAIGFSEKSLGIRGVISFYAAADLVFAHENVRPSNLLNTKLMLSNLMGGTLEDVKERYEDGSPIRLVDAGTPPVLLIHGTRDELVWIRQSQRLADVLRKAKLPHFLLELPWATHGFDYNLNGPGGQLSTYFVDRFLDLLSHKTQ